MVPAMLLIFGGGLSVWYAVENPPEGIAGAAKNLIDGKPATSSSSAQRTRAAQAATLQAAFAPSAGAGVQLQGETAAGGSGSELVDYADTFLGIPYRWGGMSRSGLDCSGLTSLVAKHAGVKLPRVAAQQVLSGKFVRVSETEARAGDFVYFGVPAYHCGIYRGDGTMTHAPKPGGVVRRESVKNLSGPVFYRRLKLTTGARA